MQASALLSQSPNSPSFNTYSSANLAEIAARVVEEFRNESDLDSDIFQWDDTESNLLSFQQHKEEKGNSNEDGEKDEDEEEEFEFAILCRKPESPISADEIFFNGQIKPIYPFFNRDLLLNDSQHQTRITDNNKPKTNRLPLGKLMSEERETLAASASCSSSEADDLDNLQPGTYCVWTPKASESHGRCKKSNSTGSSKRWKFRHLLYRINSDGKYTFVFLTPNKKNTDHHHHHQKVGEESNKENKASAGAGKVKVVEEHDAKNRAIKEEDKKRSFLPCKQDLMGFFNNVNGLSKSLHPF